MIGPRRRIALARSNVRYYSRHHRWTALVRALFWVFVYGHESELCEECGRRYERGLSRVRHFFLWRAPMPLWMDVNGRYGGCLCHECFNRKARAAGYGVTWTPVVDSRYDSSDKRIATTNHWSNEARDWLLMGVPDPEYPDRSEPRVWAVVRDALIEAGYELPPIDYYPADNFKLPSRSIPGAGV